MLRQHAVTEVVMRHTARFRVSVTLLIVAFIGACEASPTANSAATRVERDRATELKLEIRRLKREARQKRRALDAAAIEIESLQQELTARTLERNRALARAATLQAALKSRPSALTAGTEQVRREVARSEYVLREAGVPYEHKALLRGC